VNSAQLTDLETPTTSPTLIGPDNLADYLSAASDYCLFLDIDGTLAEFTLDPKDSFIPTSTLTLLQNIQSSGIQVGIVTGRSLVEAKQMLSLLQLPIAATHGLEMSWKNDPMEEINFSELSQIKQNLTDACQPYPNLRIENKPYSCALHYRKDPTLADISHSLMFNAIHSLDNWMLKPGKYVWEAVPKGINKGTAILALQQYMSQSQPLCPIFIGDDITDEAGFKAVQNLSIPVEQSTDSDSKFPKQLQGIGIKVGNEPTCANYYVQDIDAVSELLEGFVKITMSDCL
jgi:trehalose 6-phosphate phosphatase